MDSILEYEQSEIDGIIGVIADAREVFKANAADLFDDAFIVLTSAGAKIETFKILRRLQAVSQEDGDGDTEEI